MIKYLVCLGGPVIVGANAFLLSLNLSRADPLLISLNVGGIALGIATTYWACKVWYYQGKLDVYHEMEERWRK